MGRISYDPLWAASQLDTVVDWMVSGLSDQLKHERGYIAAAAFDRLDEAARLIEAELPEDLLEHVYAEDVLRLAVNLALEEEEDWVGCVSDALAQIRKDARARARDAEWVRRRILGIE
jgi:hypothetical protein